MAEYGEGICADGAAILRDGQPMRITEIIAALQAAEDSRRQERARCVAVLRDWRDQLSRDYVRMQEVPVSRAHFGSSVAALDSAIARLEALEDEHGN